MSQNYTFRPFKYGDLDLVSKWLSAPDVAFWYRDPDYIEDLEEHLDDARINQQIVLHGQIPFAYVQDYEIHGWPGHHLAFLPFGSRGIDTFIGRSDMIGKGHGRGYLKTLVDLLFGQETPSLGIDPDPQNIRAIRAYQHIGFEGTEIVETEWGEMRLMSLFGGKRRSSK